MNCAIGSQFVCPSSIILPPPSSHRLLGQYTCKALNIPRHPIAQVTQNNTMNDDSTIRRLGIYSLLSVISVPRAQVVVVAVESGWVVWLIVSHLRPTPFIGMLIRTI